MRRSAEVAQLILVLGFPRSGTSWFSNLINSHPDTVYRHEVIGRQYQSFGDSLYRRLKFDNGLSDKDRARVVRTLLAANIETDKPPFFRKRFRSASSVRLRKLMWLAGHAPTLGRLYSVLYTPRVGDRVTLVVKETRSSANLDSIISGVRADRLIVLIRHPYGVIASHLRGMAKGVMPYSSIDSRRQWYRHLGKSQYVMGVPLSESDVLDMKEPEFCALTWRVQNEDYLRIHALHPASQVVSYDAFLKNTLENTAKLLDSLGLGWDKQVMQFILESSGQTKKANILKEGSSNYFSVYRGNQFRANAWCDLLTADDRRGIDRYTVDLVDRLGLNELGEGEEPVQLALHAAGKDVGALTRQ